MHHTLNQNRLISSRGEQTIKYPVGKITANLFSAAMTSAEPAHHLSTPTSSIWSHRWRSLATCQTAQIANHSCTDRVEISWNGMRAWCLRMSQSSGSMWQGQHLEGEILITRFTLCIKPAANESCLFAWRTSATAPYFQPSYFIQQTWRNKDSWGGLQSFKYICLGQINLIWRRE